MEGNSHIIQLSNYVKPKVFENVNEEWVLNGYNNSFFQYIIDRYNGSPTNAALVDAYIDRIYGKGLSVLNPVQNAAQYAALLSILKPREVKKIVSDFKLFGSAVMQIRYGSGSKRKIAKVEHLDRISVAPNVMNKEGVIEYYWVCKDWQDTNLNKPKKYPAFGVKEGNTEIFEIRPYKAGKHYFADPGYLGGLQYAMLEEEISNFSVNHIKNGLSMGWVLNYNNGIPKEEEQIEIVDSVKAFTTGSGNAGVVMVNFNDSQETSPTIEAVPTNANHEQWQFWANEARQQLLVAHRVTTPMLVGVKDNTGLGNNANEMKEGSKLLHETAVRPEQNVIIDHLQEIVAINGISAPLKFIPLEDEEEKEQKQEEVQLSEDELISAADYLVSLGEDPDEQYEEIDVRPATKQTLSEDKLNVLIQLASNPTGDARKASEQDTSLFKIRYQYAGSPLPERTFCRKIVTANKVYRAEDLQAAENRVVNPGFGPEGTNRYSIWLYKGGVNCKHWWKRIIYLKKNNKKVSVNQARKMINALEPSERADAKWDQNEPEVAQVAGPNNNHWKLN